MGQRIRAVLHQPLFWGALFAIVIVQFLGALPAALTKRVLDAATARSWHTIVVTLIIYGLCVLAMAGLEFFSQWLQARFEVRQEVLMKNALADAILHKSSTEFNHYSQSRYQNLFDNEIPTIGRDFYVKLLQLVQGVSGLVFNLLILSYLDPVLMAITFVVSFLPLIIPFAFNHALNQQKARYLSAQSETIRHFLNIISGHSIIRNFGAIANFSRIFRRADAEYEQQSRQYNRTEAASNIASGIAFYVSTILILGVGSWRAFTGIITIGAVAGVLQSNEALVYPIQMIAETLKDIMGSKKVIAGLDVVLAPGAEKPAQFAISQRKPAAIELDHVSYQVAGQPIINDLSLRLELGKRYLIMGDSGAGKSTLLKLIKGSIQPTSGKVCLPAGLTPDQIQLVDQSHFVFEASLANNIRLYSEDAQPLAPLMRQVDLTLDPDRRPDGLSDGQKQRLAILRGLYFPSKVLLLDEVTSALDVANRHLVEDAFSRYDGTLISVTHHIDSRDRTGYDTVIKLHDGQVTAVEAV